MRKPFYEMDFNVKEYINKRILEMENLSDRILYKEMAENFMIPFFEMQREEREKLTQKVLSEVSLVDDTYEVCIGMMEKSKFDGTDTFLYPMINEVDNKNSVDVINEALKNKEPYFMGNLYLKEYYTKLDGFKAVQYFKGTIKTSTDEYEATFLVQQNMKYINILKELYHTFKNNGAVWNTVILSHLIRIFSLSICEVHTDKIQGDFIDFNVDFEEYSSKIIRDIIPLWNIKSLTEMTSSFPISINDGIKYEHSIFLEEKKKDTKIIVGNLDVEIYEIVKSDDKFLIICNDGTPREWLFYEIFKNTKNSSYDFPILSNHKSENLHNNLKTKYQSKISTKSEIYRFINESEFADKISLLKVQVVNNYKKSKKVYDMNSFYEDEVVNNDDKKILLLTFESKDISDYLIYDYMSYITTNISQNFREYCVLAELAGD